MPTRHGNVQWKSIITHWRPCRAGVRKSVLTVFSCIDVSSHVYSVLSRVWLCALTEHVYRTYFTACMPSLTLLSLLTCSLANVWSSEQHMLTLLRDPSHDTGQKLPPLGTRSLHDTGQKLSTNMNPSWRWKWNPLHYLLSSKRILACLNCGKSIALHCMSVTCDVWNV